MSLGPISVFDRKASEETPHAGYNLQEGNPDSLSVAKHLSDLVNSHAHSILNKTLFSIQPDKSPTFPWNSKERWGKPKSKRKARIPTERTSEKNLFFIN